MREASLGNTTATLQSPLKASPVYSHAVGIYMTLALGTGDLQTPGRLFRHFLCAKLAYLPIADLTLLQNQLLTGDLAKKNIIERSNTPISIPETFRAKNTWNTW